MSRVNANQSVVAWYLPGRQLQTIRGWPPNKSYTYAAQKEQLGSLLQSTRHVVKEHEGVANLG